MEISKNSVNDVTVARLAGILDSSTAGDLHAEILPMLMEGRPLLLDFGEVSHVSDAGLRTMLVIYRQAQCVDGRVAVVGLNPDLRSALAATGFLRFFAVADDLAGGLAALGTSEAGTEHRRSVAA
ncbi:STAS domain-containing protein [Micromonospora sp. NPDC048999]|uniref:STAS domain-containing protein n=1 Tax=Micromonospora sp. NPDC048999 TaxID=3155391 RepID=UPI0033FC31EF